MSKLSYVLLIFGWSAKRIIIPLIATLIHTKAHRNRKIVILCGKIKIFCDSILSLSQSDLNQGRNTDTKEGKGSHIRGHLFSNSRLYFRCDKGANFVAESTYWSM